jgi:citrate synthase
MSEWIDRAQALKTLGVRAQTLYAYVSRGRITMQPDPDDPRRSLYRTDDVAALATRRARGRKTATIAASVIAWGEPSISTSVSTVHHGRLIYRGMDAETLAGSATLEAVAAVLWDQVGEVGFPVSAAAVRDPFQALSCLMATSQPSMGRSAERLRRDGEVVVGTLAAAIGAEPGTDPVHLRLAREWALRGQDIERVRRALVLLADHELNASTFATRVAASTGASLAASLLAGLSALSGPRHGGAGAALITLIEMAERDGAEHAVAAWLARGEALPGFGHKLYPDGDPRARMLLEGLALDAVTAGLRQAVFDATGALPNVDFGLAAFTRAADLPATAPFALFLLGRSVGWVAHAIEQAMTGQLIRPRARYQGVLSP